MKRASKVVVRGGGAMAASVASVRDCKMSGWKVLYRDNLDQDRTSRSSPSEQAALQRARQLYLEGRAEIYRIEGPNGLVVQKDEIMRWLCANKQ
jgi:hypothetical protein